MTDPWKSGVSCFFREYHIRLLQTQAWAGQVKKKRRIFRRALSGEKEMEKEIILGYSIEY